MKKLFLVLVAVTMTATIMGQQNSGEYVDLGLPSGILWKSANEDGLFTWQQAIDKYGEQLPTKEELTELIEEARWFNIFFDMQTLCKGHNVRLVKRKAK